MACRAPAGRANTAVAVAASAIGRVKKIILTRTCSRRERHLSWRLRNSILLYDALTLYAAPERVADHMERE